MGQRRDGMHVAAAQGAPLVHPCGLTWNLKNRAPVYRALLDISWLALPFKITKQRKAAASPYVPQWSYPWTHNTGKLHICIH